MPLVVLLALGVATGGLASLAAARELRASPRPSHQSRAFRAVALHEALVAMPVAAYVLARFTDWAVGYVANGARIPSVVLAAAVFAQGALALGAFVVGSHWLREHRPRGAMGLALGGGAVAVVALVAGHARAGVYGTAMQFRSGFGMQTLAEAGVLGTLLVLTLAWLGAAAHLCWTLSRTR